MLNNTNNIKNFVPYINKEGYSIIAIFCVGAIIAFSISEIFGIIGLILTVWCVFFFRDPNRITPKDASVIISAADGVIQSITKNVSLPSELGISHDINMQKVSVFLSIFDVHVTRMPISGVVKNIQYRPGKFINASFDKASTDNERQSLLIESNYNTSTIAVILIAGLIARRIVCNIHDINEKVTAGNRFGIIKFGSRVDLYLPSNIELSVLVGQRVVGGETIIGKFPSIIT